MNIRHSKFYTRDTRLEAIGPGPQQLSWLKWQGDLAPIVQAVISAVSPALTDGPKLGQPFSAEQGPASQAMLGVIFNGAYQQFRQAIVNARADGSAAGSDTVDIAEVVQHTINLQNMLEDSDKKGAEAALHALQAASDAIGRSRRAGKKTADASTYGARESRRVIAALTQFRDGAQKLWAKPAAVVTGDAAASDGKVRDLMHRSQRSTHMAEKVGAMNEAAREFWRGRTADVSAPSVATVAPANGSIEAINKNNSDFWAARR